MARLYLRDAFRKKLTEYGLSDIHRPPQKPPEDEDDEEKAN